MIPRVRVHYMDTDQMGVANYAADLRWLEIGRAEWIRARGKSYRDIEKTGYLMPVTELVLKYRESARYDDLLDIEVSTEDLRAASVRFTYQIKRDGVVLCEGSTVHACVNKSGRVSRFPDDLVTMLRP